MAGKPGDKKTPASPPEGAGDSGPGKLGTDDRGNVTWEWKNEGDLLADEPIGTAERVRALLDPSMDVADGEDAPDSPLSVNPKRLKTGYNPYNSGALGKQSWKKKKDLHELSKWIELRKRIDEKKDDE